MRPLGEERRVGLDYLDAVTTLLQRIRAAHPTAGLYESADLQWWWADAAPTTDNLSQLFWFDHLDRPQAAVIATDWGERIALDPILMPLREVLVGHGFVIEDDGLAETWLSADARPAISPRHEDYRLSNRLDTMGRPHHMNGPKRRHADVESRLRQTSL